MIIRKWYKLYFKSTIVNPKYLIPAVPLAHLVIDDIPLLASCLFETDAGLTMETWEANLDHQPQLCINLSENAVTSSASKYKFSLIAFTPDVLTYYDAKTIRFITAHEIAHIKYRDSKFLSFTLKYEYFYLFMVGYSVFSLFLMAGLLASILYFIAALIVVPLLISYNHRLAEKRADSYAFSRGHTIGAIPFFSSKTTPKKQKLMDSILSFFSTHPSVESRLEAAYNYLHQHPQE